MRSEFNVLKEGATCWRIAHAERASVLVDGAAYYGALRASLLKARRSVFILGWDIDSRTRLVGCPGEADDGLPEQLSPFLTALVARRPDLKIHVLLWDYSMIFALSREPLPQVNLAWRTPEQISVCLDDALPVGACHHTKIVVIDDAVAFCGGLDLTIRRWDTPAHDMSNANRLDPAGEPYRPFHDVQMMVDGEAAAALGVLARGRWREAACETPIRLQPVGDPWPDHVPADLRDVPVGIARTLPPYEGSAGIREVEALYKRAIDAAERSIYIECQFLTAEPVAVELARRMRENGDLTAIIVGPNVHYSWLEEHSMNGGRLRFMNVLKQAGVLDRVRLLYPAVPDDPTEEGVMVHAKLMIADDRFLRVGSSNLNNRSMGVDTECDLAVEAVTEDHRKAIADIRNRLLAEHLGADVRTVRSAIGKRGSLLAAVEALSDGGRSLRPVDLSKVSEDELTRTVGQFADPEKPIETPTFLGDLFGGAAENTSLRRYAKLFAAAVAVLAMVLVWRYTPLSELTDPAALVPWMEQLRQDLWMPLFIPLVFVVAGLIAFPVTILIAVMGMMFSPLTAFAYGLGGSLLSAAVIFFIGRMIGRGPLRTLIGSKVNRISRTLARQGILSVATLRMVPIAPFSVINLIAGAVRIGTLDFFVGTVLGMTPGILAISFLGHQLARTLTDPTGMELLLLGLGIAGWLLLCVGLQYLASRLRSRAP